MRFVDLNSKRKKNEQILRIGWWMLASGVIIIVIAIRIRLLGIPLERDEGEYAYAGQLLLQGIPPYKLAYNMKFPGTYAAYALIMSIFGQSVVGIHLGLLVVNMATVVVVFLIGRRLVDATMGIAAATSYAVLSLSPAVLGLAGHATHFVVLPVLAGALLLLSPSQPKKLVFVSGVLFGAGLLMKQPALPFILFGAGYLFYRDWRARVDLKQILFRNALFISGSALPLGATCLLLWWAGVFAKFWFWTVVYAHTYGSLISPSDGIQMFLNTGPGIVSSEWPLWALAALGVIAVLRDKKICSCAIFLFGMLIFSALALCAGFYFRQHYFILVLPAISLLAGAAVASAANYCSRLSRFYRVLPFVVFGVASILPLLTGKAVFFSPDPVSVCRKVYGVNPFPEAVRIADYLQKHTTSHDTIAVIGSEPEIYFYSHRRSATGYIYTYGLMEPQKDAPQMQHEMIQEIEAVHPKYLILVAVSTSWVKQASSETLIFDWLEKYSAENFALTGLVNIVSRERTEYYVPLSVNPESIQLSRYYLLIYERKA